MSNNEADDEIEEVIREAIIGRRVLAVQYKNTYRTVHPYLIYESQNGTLLLHSWQVSGEWGKTPPPDWCNMKLSQIGVACPTGDRFVEPNERYNPYSSEFYRVICQVPPVEDAS